MYVEFLQDVAIEALRRGERENAKVILQVIGALALKTKRGIDLDEID